MKKSEWKKAAIKARAKVRRLQAKCRRLRRMERVAYEGLRKASEEGRAEIQALTKERDEAKAEADRLRALPRAPLPKVAEGEATASPTAHSAYSPAGLSEEVQDLRDRAEILNLPWWRSHGWSRGWKTSLDGNELLCVLCVLAEGPWDGKDRRAIARLLGGVLAPAKARMTEGAQQALQYLIDLGAGREVSAETLRYAAKIAQHSRLADLETTLGWPTEEVSQRAVLSRIVVQAVEFVLDDQANGAEVQNLLGRAADALGTNRKVSSFVLAQRIRDLSPLPPRRVAQIDRCIAYHDLVTDHGDIRFFDGQADPQGSWEGCKRGDMMLARLVASAAWQAWNSPLRCEIVRHLCHLAIHWLPRGTDRRLKAVAHLGRMFPVGRKDLFKGHQTEHAASEIATSALLADPKVDLAQMRRMRRVQLAVDAIFVAARTTAHSLWLLRVMQALDAVFEAASYHCDRDHFMDLLAGRILTFHPDLPALPGTPPLFPLAEGSWPGECAQADEIREIAATPQVAS